MSSALAYPRIVAIPGFGGSGADYSPLIHRMSDWSWKPLTWPGCAGTEYDPATFSYQADSLCAWLSHVLRPNDVLMGYSMGGRLVYQAISRGLPLAGAVIIGAVPGIEGAEKRRARQLADQQLAAKIRDIGVSAFHQEWAQRPLINTQQRIASPYREEQALRRLDNALDGLVDALKYFGQGVVRPETELICRMEVPTLLVTGAEDTKYTELAADLAERWPAAEHATLEAGHAAHLESPDEMAKLVEEFWRCRL